jgi:tripartite-type tricarboxylate transporter receptor subunit TctC
MGTVGTHAINASLYAKLPYDHVKDFAPVILVAGVPNVLEVNPSPVNSVQELIAYAKANRQAQFCVVGRRHIDSPLRRIVQGHGRRADDARPYKGSAPALQDLIGGQVQLMFDNLPPSLPQIKAGKLRALAVTSATRAAALPDVPTVSEAGLPGFEASSWFGVLAPAGTPPDIVTKLNAEIAKWLTSPEAKEKLASVGANIAGGTPEDFANHIQMETAKWAKVVRSRARKSTERSRVPHSVGWPIASKIARSCGLIATPRDLPEGSLRMNHCS